MNWNSQSEWLAATKKYFKMISWNIEFRRAWIFDFVINIGGEY